MKSSCYWKVSEILELRKYAEVRPFLTQHVICFFLDHISLFFVKCKIISFFFPSYEWVWHIIIVNIPTCDWTAEGAKEKTTFQNSYTSWNHYYVVSLLKRLCVQFYLYHSRNSYAAWWIISLNSIRNRSHLKNE